MLKSREVRAPHASVMPMFTQLLALFQRIATMQAVGFRAQYRDLRRFSAVAPASRRGRGLKLFGWWTLVSGLVVAPAFRRGRGLKHQHPHGGQVVERVAPASRRGRGLKPTGSTRRSATWKGVAPASRRGRGLKLPGDVVRIERRGRCTRVSARAGIETAQAAESPPRAPRCTRVSARAGIETATMTAAWATSRCCTRVSARAGIETRRRHGRWHPAPELHPRLGAGGD